MPRTTFIRTCRIHLFITTICTTRFLPCVPVEGPSRSCLTDHRPTLDQIKIHENKIHVPTTYGCVQEHMLLAGDGAEDGSQNNFGGWTGTPLSCCPDGVLVCPWWAEGTLWSLLARARLAGSLKGYTRNDTGKSVGCCSLDGKPRGVAISTDSLA